LTIAITSAVTATTPAITGRSLRMSAFRSIWPRRGGPNAVSTKSSVGSANRPMSIATIGTTGMKAFGSARRRSTAHSLMPFAQREDQHNITAHAARPSA
jgi:hypothetical protein